MRRQQAQGQASLILILLTAMAIIFFAISLNWQRIAQVKTLTMSAATTTASSMGSSYASYAEKVMQTSLGGVSKICKRNSIFAAFLTLLIVVAIVFLSVACAACGAVFGAATAPLLAAAVAMAVLNLALQVLVVQPGLTRLWNKMQSNLPITAQFVEQGVQNGIQNVVTDPIQVPDLFDLNTNGMIGFSGARPEDMVPRFGIYYTERLKSLQVVAADDLTLFLNALRGLSAEITVPCTDINDPHCNPCCVPLKDPNLDPYSAPRLRPGYCSADNIPPGCANTTVWPHASTFYYAYDPAYPDYKNGTSFLAKMGVDAEVRQPSPDGPFDPHQGDAKGLFSIFWGMEKLLTDPDRAIGPAAAPDSFASGIITDNVLPASDYKIADENTCTNDIDSALPGLNWKKGYDLYCSSRWPYDVCAKHSGACTVDVDGVAQCKSCSESINKKQWPEDGWDDIVYGLKEFYVWSNNLGKGDATQLRLNIDQWYPDAMTWFAKEKCVVTTMDAGSDMSPYTITTITNQHQCTDATPDGKGRLRQYPPRLNKIKDWLNGWLAKTDNVDSSNNAWCLPANALANPLNLISTAEENYILSKGSWGSLESVEACFDYNKDNDVKFGDCAADLQTAFLMCAGGAAPALPVSCQNLPRSLVGPAPAYDLCSTPSLYMKWAQDSRDYFVKYQKTKFNSRLDLIKEMKTKARDLVNAIDLFLAKLEPFLEDGGPIDSLINIYNGVLVDPSSKLPGYVIYGWKDAPVKTSTRPYWHIVSAEVSGPGNCPKGNCGPNRLAWVRTYTKGFLGSTRCYELQAHTGRVAAKITRWDQDRQAGVSFANKFPIWKLMFSKPGSPVRDWDRINDDLNRYCGEGRDDNDGNAVGLSKATLDALIREGITSADKKNLRNAFMINVKSGACWDVVKDLLPSGISSQACMRYQLGRNGAGREQIQLRFVGGTECDKGAL